MNESKVKIDDAYMRRFALALKLPDPTNEFLTELEARFLPRKPVEGEELV